MAKYLDPKADLTFKKIFGEHPDLVISLLNALLPFSEEQKITEIEYLPAEMPPEKPLFKNTIVDVRCKAIDGRQFIVEMQMEWTTAFKQRVLFNASKAYVRQLGKSHKYHLLQPVYCLSLVNDIFEPDIPDFYHYYRLVHEEHTEKIIDGLNLVFVELPKFKPQTVSEKKMQVLWLRFLTEIGEDTKEVPEELLENPDVKRAVEIVEESAYSEAEMYAYDKFWDAIRVEQAFVDEAEIRYGIGIKKGVKDAKLDTAHKLKAMNVMTIEQIAEATGLTAEEIEKL
ncbi:MAG: Rpn family recombination-promoting nuclease/putative transposase [Aeriscardovia sp.]|nr:Rpn family recombination-promoting nuclease/putative transposase [Aeriscardovia sp.]